MAADCTNCVATFSVPRTLAAARPHGMSNLPNLAARGCVAAIASAGIDRAAVAAVARRSQAFAWITRMPSSLPLPPPTPRLITCPKSVIVSMPA